MSIRTRWAGSRYLVVEAKPSLRVGTQALLGFGVGNLVDRRHDVYHSYRRR